MTVGNLADHSLAAQRAASEPAQLGGRSRFVDKNSRVGVKMRLPITPSGAVSGHVGTILFSRPQDFF